MNNLEILNFCSSLKCPRLQWLACLISTYINLSSVTVNYSRTNQILFFCMSKKPMKQRNKASSIVCHTIRINFQNQFQALCKFKISTRAMIKRNDVWYIRFFLISYFLINSTHTHIGCVGIPPKCHVWIHSRIKEHYQPVVESKRLEI